MKQTIKHFKLAYLFGLVFFLSCNNKPTKLSGIEETIQVSYVNWACDCPDFIETKYFKQNPKYEAKEEDCIYIEPLNDDSKIPENFYRKDHFNYYLKLNGQFYTDKGIPESYEEKTPEKAQKGKVFRYKSYEFVKK